MFLCHYNYNDTKSNLTQVDFLKAWAVKQVLRQEFGRKKVKKA